MSIANLSAAVRLKRALAASLVDIIVINSVRNKSEMGIDFGVTFSRTDLLNNCAYCNFFNRKDFVY
jgi:hypothetical protein